MSDLTVRIPTLLLNRVRIGQQIGQAGINSDRSRQCLALTVRCVRKGEVYTSQNLTHCASIAARSAASSTESPSVAGLVEDSIDIALTEEGVEDGVVETPVGAIDEEVALDVVAVVSSWVLTPDVPVQPASSAPAASSAMAAIVRTRIPCSPG